LLIGACSVRSWCVLRFLVPWGHLDIWLAGPADGRAGSSPECWLPGGSIAQLLNFRCPRLVLRSCGVARSDFAGMHYDCWRRHPPLRKACLGLACHRDASRWFCLRLSVHPSPTCGQNSSATPLPFFPPLPTLPLDALFRGRFQEARRRHTGVFRCCSLPIILRWRGQRYCAREPTRPGVAMALLALPI